MTRLVWLIFITAAVLEVGGDAIIRQGLQGKNLLRICLGCVSLGCYGVLVNMVQWDFSRLLGAYVALFALVSVLWGRFLFQESVPLSTWVGLGFITVGGLIIQYGHA